MTTGIPTLYGLDPHADLGFRPVRALPSPVPRPRVDPTRAARSTPRPAWMPLYALLPLCAALFMLADSLLATGALRTLAEGVVIALVSGLAAVWVRASRCERSRVPRDSETESRPSETTLEVHHASPRVIHLTPHRNHSAD